MLGGLVVVMSINSVSRVSNNFSIMISKSMDVLCLCGFLKLFIIHLKIGHVALEVF